MELLKTRIKGYSIYIASKHLVVLEKILKSGTSKIRIERLLYLKGVLNDLGWELSAERLQEYIAELQEVSPSTTHRIDNALRVFIKHVLRDPNLYSILKTPKVESLGVAL